MKKLLAVLFIFILSVQHIFAQSTSDESDGKIVNATQNIPVKIFSTTRNDFLQNKIFQKNNNNLLIIINEQNVDFKSEDLSFITRLFSEAQHDGYTIYNKNFQAIPAAANQNLKEIKYLYHPSNAGGKVSGEHSELKTDFKIWDPSIGINLGFITIHYYSLMFLVAFGLGFLLMKKIYSIDGVDEKYLEPLLTWTIVGTIFGARIGHVLFYQRELITEDFWSVFLPISTKNGIKFTGFSGLASHGATIALILTTLYYSFKVIKKNPFWVYDRLSIVIALGGAFVRLGNFFNSEIIGKPAPEGSPFAILFPQQSYEYGATIPRYPSQLFEAFGYVCLFVLLWFIYRKTDKKYQQGWIFGLFFILLWAIRFFVEFLKEPQGNEYITLGGLNTGQVLSIPFMIAGLVIMIMSSKFKIDRSKP